jgi:hypothetical protein
MEINQHEPERKPRTRRGGKDNPPPGGPRRGNAGNSARPTAETRFAVYDGTPFERAGAFQRDSASSFTAFDRRGRVIGTFASQSEAIMAIEREAKS